MKIIELSPTSFIPNSLDCKKYPNALILKGLERTVRLVMEVYVLILILSIVQSLFGVGLLLFGTPVLLLMGLDYPEALLHLLPASAALSWSQVKDTRKEKLDGGYRRIFFLICLPLLAAGMLIATKFDFKFEIKIFVLVMLIIAFVVRTNSSFREQLQALMRNNLKIAIASMGLIHGLSNMGGSILTPLVSSMYKDKNKILAGVSFDYAFMATLQLLVLLTINGSLFRVEFFAGVIISLTVRYFIGKRVFTFTSQSGYEKLLDGFILANAVLLGINLWK
jgi:uncharacterized membrane protein YfcA